MPRYRKLHVKTVESLDLNDMPDDFTRLMWVLLPLGLCREGRGIDNPAWVKSKLFPLRLDVTPETITAAMDWYEKRGMLVRYQVEGRGYFYLPSFPKYQGNTIKEAESNYPPPPEPTQDNSGQAPDKLPTNSVTDSVFSIQYSDADSNADADAHAPDQRAQSPEAIRSLVEKEFPELRLSEGQIRSLNISLDKNVFHLWQLEGALGWARTNNITRLSAITKAAMGWRDATGPPRADGKTPAQRAAEEFLAEEEE